MATDVLIPKLGMTMTEGTVAEWYVPDGALVSAGDPVYRLETEKIEMDVEAEISGVLRHLVPVDTTLGPGAVVACILVPGEALPAALGGLPSVGLADAAAAAGPMAPLSGQLAPASPLARRLAREHGVRLETVAGSGPGGRVTEADVLAAAAASASAGEVRASPLARRLAESLGVDLHAIRGSGPGGRVTREDIEAAAAPATPAPSAAAAATPPAESEVIPLRGMRKAIAEHMHASLQEMAQLTLAMDVWMDEVVKLRSQLVEEWAAEGVRPSYTDLVVRAVARALQQHPYVNAAIEGNAIRILPDIDVGVAVALPAGLVVPVIRNTASLSLKEIAVASARLAAAARDGRLTLDDMAGATFTVTTLGMYEVDFFTPIVNRPNAAILGVGRVRDGLAWDGDRPVRRQQMTLSLTWDHRVLDGAPAAQFVQAVKALLEAPYRLLV
ncbi:MAG: 2-oxo acid dehydrogenase subunit E2 [Dehalococcoidia bacterium]|nr:2-oxo acid dehydrogenase subunit E2 [Dehalococcoidia bacterium]